MAKKLELNKLGAILQGAESQLQQSMTGIEANLVILAELEHFIPKLSPLEFSLLEESIKTEGVREPLDVWKDTDPQNAGRYILVDGHNRYRIAKSLKKELRFREVEFSNILEVKQWMVFNQMGKRNLSEDAKSYLRGAQYRIEKQKQGGTGANQHVQKSRLENFSSLLNSASQRLAEEYKVTDRTIRNDEKFADAVDAICALGGNEANWKNYIFSKTFKYAKAELIQLSTLPQDQAKTVVDAINENGGKGNLKELLNATIPLTKKEVISKEKEIVLKAELKPAIEKMGKVLGNNVAKKLQNLTAQEAKLRIDKTNKVLEQLQKMLLSEGKDEKVWQSFDSAMNDFRTYFS